MGNLFACAKRMRGFQDSLPYLVMVSICKRKCGRMRQEPRPPFLTGIQAYLAKGRGEWGVMILAVED